MDCEITKETLQSKKYNELQQLAKKWEIKVSKLKVSLHCFVLAKIENHFLLVLSVFQTAMDLFTLFM